jgi:hypothetical protein
MEKSWGKMWREKFGGAKKFLARKNFLARKIFWREEFCGAKKFWREKIFVGGFGPKTVGRDIQARYLRAGNCGPGVAGRGKNGAWHNFLLILSS